jgi:hypothetical protein
MEDFVSPRELPPRAIAPVDCLALTVKLDEAWLDQF